MLSQNDILLKMKTMCALGHVVTGAALPIPYKPYFDACLKKDYRGRMAILNEDIEVSPFIMKQWKNYCFIGTTDFKRHLQEKRIREKGRSILSAEEIGDISLLRSLKNKMEREEQKIVVLNEEDIQLQNELIEFLNPESVLKLKVINDEGKFHFYDNVISLKKSRYVNGNTRRIEECIVSFPDLNISCYDLFPPEKHENPASILSGSIPSIRKFISRALERRYPKLFSRFNHGNEVKLFHDCLLDLYAPFIEKNCLVKFSKTQFIIT